MASHNSLTEEIEDLSTCCICLESYNEGEQKPKFISCFHTYCLSCVKVMARKAINNRLACPKCKQESVLPTQEVENLTTNVYVLNNIQLKRLLENGHCWCLKCESIPKVDCVSHNHTVLNHKKDAEEIVLLLTEAFDSLDAVADKRQDLSDHLQVRVDHLEAQLKVARAHKEHNARRLEILKSQLKEYRQMKHLSPRDGATASSSSVKENIKEIIQQAKKEFQETQKLLEDDSRQTGAIPNFVTAQSDCVSGPSSSMKRKTIEVEEETVEAAAVSTTKKNHILPGFTAEWLISQVGNNPFNCRQLTAKRHLYWFTALEFSTDGSLLAAGGTVQRRLVIWRVNDVLNQQDEVEPASIVMEGINRQINNLVIAPDNGRIFSCRRNGEMVIHNIQTTKVLTTVPATAAAQQVRPMTISFQADSNGNIFSVTNGNDKVVRIYDTRIRDAVTQQQQVKRTGKIYSAMFSPVDAMHLAAAGVGGTEVFDIRNPDSCLHSFPSSSNNRVQYSRDGSRILCKESKKLVTYQLSNDQQVQFVAAPGFASLNTDCFAGNNDELVVSGLRDRKMHLFSIPKVNQEQTVPSTVVHSFFDFPTHVAKDIECVRYSPQNSTLASCNDSNVIQLWTPKIE